MKLLYLMHQFYPMHYTGTEKVILGISTMMQKMGHKVKVLSYSFYDTSFYDTQDGPILSKAFVYNGIDVVAFRHVEIPISINMSMTDEGLAVAADRMLAKEIPDVVHVGHLMRVGELLTASRRLGIPYVMTLTDFWLICPKFTLVNSQNDLCAGPDGGKTCFMDCPDLSHVGIPKRLGVSKEILGGAASLIAPSHFLAGVFRTEIPALDIQVLGHGLRNKSSQKTRHYQAGDTITLCFAGSFNRHKGAHLVIDAVRKVASDRIRLRIYGSGDPEYTKCLEQLAGGDPRIDFRGVYTAEEVWDVLESVDVVVVPSVWYETYGLIMREALLFKVPVVASDVGVMAEVVKNGVNGFTFRVGDSAHLREVLERIVRKPQLLNALSANTRDTMVPSIEQEACAYERIYRNASKAS